MKLNLREELAAEFLKGILAGSYSSIEVLNFWNATAAQEMNTTRPGVIVATAFTYADAFLAQCSSQQSTNSNEKEKA